MSSISQKKQEISKSGLVLTEIALKQISSGGYRIGYLGTLPSGTARLLLFIPGAKHSVDVTKSHKSDLLDSKVKLATFLQGIATNRSWGKKEKCIIVAKDKNGNELARSDPKFFDTPVCPYTGALTPLCVGKCKSDFPPPKYTGKFEFDWDDEKWKSIGGAAYLYPSPIDGCYYFAYAGKFVKDNKERGFDCTTFVGSAFGVDPNTPSTFQGKPCNAMAGDGGTLADVLKEGGKDYDLKHAKASDVLKFFEKNRVGTYVMWSSGHVVIVHDLIVYEFIGSAEPSKRKDGFDVHPITQWFTLSGHHLQKFSVCKTRRQFPKD